MKYIRILSLVVVLSLLASALPLPMTQAASQKQEAGSYHRQLVNRGTTFMPPALPGEASISPLEFPGSSGAQANKLSQLNRPGLQGIVNRSFAHRPDTTSILQMAPEATEDLTIPKVKGIRVTRDTPGLLRSWEGLNHFDQRTANNGNQFSLEPPDQGLCVGNGFVMETVNDVLQVYDMDGNAISGVIDQNTFYRYPPAIERDRNPLRFGPFLTDPNCYYDPDVQRWFHTILTLEQHPLTGELLGENHIDIAVSQTADPTGAWNLYSIPTQNNGTQGTPDHDCEGGFCLGDYPQIGADAYGFYITTNEFALFADQFTSAQIYAMSKRELADGIPNPKLIHFDNLQVGGHPGFTVWPATSPAGEYHLDNGGTEFFLSSLAVFNEETGLDNRLGVWGLFNTSSLDTDNPDLNLRRGTIRVNTYGVPPPAEQREGPTPLRDCLNDREIETPFGTGCWQFFLTEEPEQEEEISKPDTGDSRIMRTWFANGRLMGTLDTIVRVGSEVRAGIAYYIIGPSEMINLENLPIVQGYVAVDDHYVSYPAMAILPNGYGVMAMSLMGQDYYPSAAYLRINQDQGVTDELHIAGQGVGPDDGFTGYVAFVGDPPRPRWGDYGAAVTDGESIWIASEWIAQTCTLEEYLADFTCGGTRSALANWSTNISHINPNP